MGLQLKTTGNFGARLLLSATMGSGPVDPMGALRGGEAATRLRWAADPSLKSLSCIFMQLAEHGEFQRGDEPEDSVLLDIGAPLLDFRTLLLSCLASHHTVREVEIGVEEVRKQREGAVGDDEQGLVCSGRVIVTLLAV